MKSNTITKQAFDIDLDSCYICKRKADNFPDSELGRLRYATIDICLTERGEIQTDCETRNDQVFHEDFDNDRSSINIEKVIRVKIALCPICASLQEITRQGAGIALKESQD